MIDVESFLLTSGFALIVVLIGWSNQITTRSKETRELEQEFIQNAKVKRKDYKNMINKGKSPEKSISSLVNFLYSNRDDSDIKAFDKITKIKKDLPLLNKKYSNRFWILLLTSISLLFSGIVALYILEEYKIDLVFFNLIFVMVMIYNLITTYTLEKRYYGNIHRAMEEL